MRIFYVALAGQVAGGLIVLGVDEGTLGDWVGSAVFWLAVALVIVVNLAVWLAVETLKQRSRPRTGEGSDIESSELKRQLDAAEGRAEALLADKAELVKANAQLKAHLKGRPTVAGPRRVIGIDIGRVWLSIGVLQLEPGVRRKLPRLVGDRERQQYRSPLDPRRGLAGSHVYEDLTASITQAMEKWPGEIDGIGIGMPGQIDLVDGVVHDPEFFPPGEPFALHLGATLVRDRRFRALLGRDAQEFVESSLLLDNDVRCATRRVLSDRLDRPGWDNFACVFVGGGVGAGFAFNREIYYGRRHCAGEVGHMTLHLSPFQHAGNIVDGGVRANQQNGDHGLTHEPGQCGCGQEGVHWETLTNGPGLEELAVSLDSANAERLAEAFGFPAQRPAAKQITLTMGLMLGVTALDEAAVEGAMKDMAETARCEATPAEAIPVIQALAGDPGIKAYLGDILDCYAHYFGVGISNLTNVLDLDHIAIGGGVMDALWRMPPFRSAVWHVRRRYTLGSSFRNDLIHHDVGARPGWAWEGAALTFWDPSYAAIRAAGREVADPEEVVLAPL
jgi:predicted NBD/HSP70 family sugar kinase